MNSIGNSLPNPQVIKVQGSKTSGSTATPYPSGGGGGGGNSGYSGYTPSSRATDTTKK